MAETNLPPPPKSFARWLSGTIIPVVIFVGLVLIGIVLWRAYSRSTFAPLPHVTVGLGDDWQTIIAHSTYRFREPDTSRDGYSIDFQRVDVSYSDSQHGLELPNATGILFQFENQQVYRISITQYGNVAEWEPTVQNVRALVAMVEGAGWKKGAAHPALDAQLARIQAYYDDPAHDDLMSDQFLDSWRVGDARFDIGFYRNGIAGDTYRGRTLAHDVFSIDLMIVRDETAQQIRSAKRLVRENL